MNRWIVLFFLAVIVAGVLIFRSRSSCEDQNEIRKAEEMPLSDLRANDVPGDDVLSLEEKGKQTAVAAIVLDDFGYTKKNLEGLKNIGVPLTIAVLPNTPYAARVCSFAEKNGLEVILHLPMEPYGRTASLEKDTLLVGMDARTVKKIINNAFLSVPAATGVSNHMGSKASGDGTLMALVFENLKKRDVFFLDSVTTGGSVCEDAARKAGLPYARRDVFIDNRLEKGYIEEQIKAFEKLVFFKGQAIAIGHDRGVTIGVLKEVLPAMKKKGVRFVKVSEIIDNRE